MKHLRLLAAAIAVLFGLQVNAQTWTGAAPADGDFYLYNVGTGTYLCGAVNWGTRAAVAENGYGVTLAVAEGGYTISTTASFANCYLGDNGYMDNGTAATWVFTLVDGTTDTYTMKTGDNYFYANPDDADNVMYDAIVTNLGTELPATANYGYWKLVTKDILLEDAQANATEDSPANLSMLIQCPRFDRTSITGWNNIGAVGNNNKWSASMMNYVVEKWHATIDCYQTLESMPAGKYMLKVQGYTRDNDEEYAQLYINDTEANFMHIQEDGLTEDTYETGKTVDDVYVPDNMYQAGQYFAAGYYDKNSVTATSTTTSLKIGVKDTYSDLWFVFDNFRLYYLGQVTDLSAYKEAWENALAAAQAAIASDDYAAVTGEEKTALQEAINNNSNPAATQEGYTAAAEALSNATTTFKNALASYKSLEDAKAGVNIDAWPYASDEKREAVNTAINVTATSAADAVEKATAITQAYRKYVESNGKAEGVTGAVDCTSAIVNPLATDGTNGWTQDNTNNANLGTLSNESFTDGDGNATYTYFDGGAWSNTGWTTDFYQNINIPAGKYLLQVTGRASANVTLQVYAADNTASIETIGATGGTFDRGWNDAYVVFETDGNNVKIGVKAETEAQYQWESFTRFRLTQLELTAEDTYKMTAATYGTLFYGKKNILVPDGLTAYAVTAVDPKPSTTAPGKATLTKITGDTIPAGTGVVLQGKEGEYPIYATLKEGTAVTDNMLKGSDEDAETVGDQEGDLFYKLSYANGGAKPLGFYWGAENGAAFTNAAHKAYLVVPASSSAKSFVFDFTTGIDNVEATDVNNGEVYSISGMRMNNQKLNKGIYIMGGKKVVVK